MPTIFDPLLALATVVVMCALLLMAEYQLSQGARLAAAFFIFMAATQVVVLMFLLARNGLITFPFNL